MDKRPLTADELLEHLYRGLNMEPDVQTEMDAQDLRELVNEDALEQTQPVATASSEEPPPAAAGPASVEGNAEARRAKARLAFGFTVVLAGAIVAATLYENPVPDGSVSAFAKVALVSEQEANESPPVAGAKAETVRFANPFDETEVFELPPGTSERDARDFVAGFLLERATQRQAHLR